MTERCAVCREAWGPCRKCKGKAIRAKQEATMAANGTQAGKLRKGQGICLVTERTAKDA